MDDIFKDAGSQEDVEERAPLRMSAADRARTEPPRLTDDADPTEGDASKAGLLGRLFGGSRTSVDEEGRPGAPPATTAGNGSSSTHRYRSTDQ